MVTIMEKIHDAILLIIAKIIKKGKVSPLEIDYYSRKMKSVYGIKFPRIIRIIIIDVDDVFFNRNWAEVCLGSLGRTRIDAGQ